MIIAMLAATGLTPAMVQLRPIIAEASAQTRLPATWIASVIAAESGGRSIGPHGGLRSPAGAMGVMQIMPRTWSEMIGDDAHRFDPDHARDNILVGSAYLLRLYQRFGFPGAIAAYHAGPANYRAYLKGRATLPAATRRYVGIVLGRSGAHLRNDEKSGTFAALPSIWAVRPTNGASFSGYIDHDLFISVGHGLSLPLDGNR